MSVNHWVKTRLKFVAAIDPPAVRAGSMDPEELVSFLPMEAIGEDGSLDLTRERPLSAVRDAFTAFQDGDVVVAKITPCFENGKGALARGLRRGIGFGTTELFVLRPASGKLDGRFCITSPAPTHFGSPRRRRCTAPVARNVSPGRLSLTMCSGYHPSPSSAPSPTSSTEKRQGLISRSTKIGIALPPATKSPKLDHPPLRVFRFAGAFFTAGVEIHQIDGVPVRIYGPAKSVADAFRFRNRIGLDVAIAALRDYRRKGGTMDDVWRHARICRVSRVIQPYLAAMS